MVGLRLIQLPEFIESSENPLARRYKYRVVGTTVPTYARNIVAAAAPGVISVPQGILFRQPMEALQTAYDRFDITVSYATRDREVGTMTWDADTTGGTVDVTVSKESVRRYGVNLTNGNQYASEAGSAAATNIPKHDGAINVDEEGNVSGTSIVIPSMRLNVQYKYPAGVVTLQHAYYLANLTGLVNSAPFLGSKPGEVLFMGSRLSSGEEVESTAYFQFAISPNVTSLTFGQIANIAKKGWEYVWVSYKWDKSAGRPVRKPQFAYVERLYNTGDLAALLGFG